MCFTNLTKKELQRDIQNQIIFPLQISFKVIGEMSQDIWTLHCVVGQKQNEEKLSFDTVRTRIRICDTKVFLRAK